MRIELILGRGESHTCGSCDEMQTGTGIGVPVFVTDPMEQRFAVLCSTCMDLEEAAIADGIEFTGVTNPENPEDTLCTCGHSITAHESGVVLDPVGCVIDGCTCGQFTEE
jgi:hypothetical protein